MKLGDICDIETGSLNANAATNNGSYAFFTTAKEVSRIDTYCWNTEALLVAGNANLGDVKYYNGKFNAYQRVYVLTGFQKSVLVKFLHYVLKSMLSSYFRSLKNRSAVDYIVLSTLKGFLVPLPPIEVQQYIVSILDHFEQLCGDLTGALPREIEAAQKRYEYYRDRLLNFGK